MHTGSVAGVFRQLVVGLTFGRDLDDNEMRFISEEARKIMQPGTQPYAEGLIGGEAPTFNGATATALVPDVLTDLAGGACFNDARVQIEVLGRH